jgi:SAM-dependent methyltransferase
VSYVFGHSERELERLTRQAALVESITRGFLLEAGIAHGMRVLDVGSGVGDVAFLVADLVGEEGTVIGVDRSEAAVTEARRRSEGRGGSNTSFVQGDPAELLFDAPFEAVVGRYVLQFQPDPAAMLRGVTGHVASGGIVAFHELDWTGFRSVPVVPSWDRLCQRIVDAVKAGGASTQMGSELPSVFAAAGLAAPTVRVSALVGAGADRGDVVGRAVRVGLTLRASIDASGLLSPDDRDGERLTARIVEEATASESLLLGPSEFGAWSRK